MEQKDKDQLLMLQMLVTDIEDVINQELSNKQTVDRIVELLDASEIWREK